MALDVGLIIVAGLAVLVGARELQDDEAVVRHVGVERLDHPVAIAPGVADRAIAFQAAGLAVAHQVEPVPAPALAVARIVEQPVDQFLVRVRRFIARERNCISSAGRHAD